MSAGVGAPRGVNHMVLAGQLAQRPFHLGFHSAPVRLLLPAGKPTSVVLQHDFDIQFLKQSVDEFDDHHRRRVAEARALVNDPGVAAGALS